MFGVAGFPGGAILTMGCASGAAAGRRLCTSRRASGSPGCWARACCCRANDTGGGGGGALAMTCRFAMAAGGAVTRFAVFARAPRTLSRVGATSTLEAMDAEEMSRSFIDTLALPTGCALANVRCGTAVTAPRTFLFTYVTFVMLVVVMTMVVL